MSAVRHSYTQTDYRSNPNKKPVSRRQIVKLNTVEPARPHQHSSPTVKLTPYHKLPTGLQRLKQLELATKVTSLALVAISAGFYAITYSAPQNWDRAQQELEQLQKQERQLTQLNESLKYDQAKQASSNPHLVTPDPQKSIFIEGTTPPLTVLQHNTQSEPLKQPLGY